MDDALSPSANCDCSVRRFIVFCKLKEPKIKFVNRYPIVWSASEIIFNLYYFWTHRSDGFWWAYFLINHRNASHWTLLWLRLFFIEISVQSFGKTFLEKKNEGTDHDLNPRLWAPLINWIFPLVLTVAWLKFEPGKNDLSEFGPKIFWSKAKGSGKVNRKMQEKKSKKIIGLQVL